MDKHLYTFLAFLCPMGKGRKKLCYRTMPLVLIAWPLDNNNKKCPVYKELGQEIHRCVSDSKYTSNR